MRRPKGTLTGPQLEIVTIAWNAGPPGVTVADLWAELSRSREVARTTVLTLVQRLAKRGWLVAAREGRADRFRAAQSPGETSGRIAADFVERFFGGSTADLVKSLLGSKKVRPAEVERLRRILDEAEESR